MARATGSGTRTAKAAPPSGGRGRVAMPKATRASVKAPRKTITERAASTAAAAKPGKQALLAQLEKLERDNATLRVKDRDARKAARAAGQDTNDRLAAIEMRLGSIETLLRRLGAAAAKERPPSPRGRRTVQAARDPGDAVPPGAAVAASEEDDEASAARMALDTHLSRDED